MGDASEVWSEIQAANTSWQAGDDRALRSLLHSDVVLAGAEGELLAEGIEAVTEQLRDLGGDAVVRAFEEEDPEVHLFQGTAIVRYAYTLRHFLNGRTRDVEGAELWVLERGSAGWRAVWLQALPPPGSVGPR